jgi:hypothetical protein
MSKSDHNGRPGFPQIATHKYFYALVKNAFLLEKNVSGFFLCHPADSTSSAWLSFDTALSDRENATCLRM